MFWSNVDNWHISHYKYRFRVDKTEILFLSRVHGRARDQYYEASHKGKYCMVSNKGP